jgi:ABC-type amino acid transport system permease subunit
VPVQIGQLDRLTRIVIVIVDVMEPVVEEMPIAHVMIANIMQIVTAIVELHHQRNRQIRQGQQIQLMDRVFRCKVLGFLLFNI